MRRDRQVIKGDIKATNVTTFRKNLKNNLDDVYRNSTTLIVTRPADENVVVMSESIFNDYEKEISNLNYLLKLKNADEDYKSGDFEIVDIDSI